MKKMIKKSNLIVLLGGIISFIIVLILNAIYWDNELAKSLLNAGIFSVVVILVIQNINNYFYSKIILEKRSILFIILRIVLLICVWIFMIK